MSGLEHPLTPKDGDTQYPDISEMYKKMYDGEVQEVSHNTHNSLKGLKKEIGLSSAFLKVGSGLEPESLGNIVTKPNDRSEFKITVHNDLPTAQILDTNNDDAETGGFSIGLKPAHSNREYWGKYDVLTAKALQREVPVEDDFDIDEVGEQIESLFDVLGIGVFGSGGKGSFLPIRGLAPKNQTESVQGFRIDRIETGFHEKIVEVNNEKFAVRIGIGAFAQYYGNFGGEELQDTIHENLGKVTYDLDYDEQLNGKMSGGLTGVIHLEYKGNGKFSLYTFGRAKANLVGPVRNREELTLVSGGKLDLGKVSFHLGGVFHYLDSDTGYGTLDYHENDTSTTGVIGGARWDINKKWALECQTANTHVGREDINYSECSVVITY